MDYFHWYVFCAALKNITSVLDFLSFSQLQKKLSTQINGVVVGSACPSCQVVTYIKPDHQEYIIEKGTY